MKKIKMMRVASILLVAVLLTTCAISGTFAKYTSSVNDTSSAKVAKWAFTFGKENTNLINSFSFDLFETINDTTNQKDETDVKDGCIAPGTEGEFNLNLTNNSEVNATYSITYEVTNSLNVPLEYNVTGEETGWTSSLANVENQAIAMEGGKADITVKWRWAYDGEHTQIGVDANTETNLSVKATVTVTQVD